jgi:AcrR family transcriptional regulator
LGRKRSESSRKAILRAALDALKSEGYAAISIESIARSAGVGKQTIYRWWSSKGSLVLDALREDAKEAIDEQQSHDPIENLRLFLSSSFRRLTEPEGTGRAVCWLMAQAQLDPKFLISFREEFVRVRREALLRVLRDGRDNEALRQEDEEFLMDLVFGAMWYRLLIGHGDLDDSFARRLSDLVFREQAGLHPENNSSRQPKGENP